ncbi:MAG: hypothetical protein ABIH83_01270 [Candidatus Micrarchaeota archaeon]
MKKAFIFSIAILSLLLGVFALDESTWGGGGGWGEEVEVRVLDAHNRPVEGAEVYIIWEISESRGEGQTKTKIANDRGRAEFSLTNIEFNEEDTDYTYDVYAKYGKAENKTEFEYNVSSMPKTVNLEVYKATFWARDKDLKPLKIGLNVDDRYELETNENGIVYILLDKGKHYVKPMFLDVRDVIEFELEEDAQINLTVKLYSLSVRVIDDMSTPLSAQVYAGSQTKKSIDDGWAYFSNITKSDLMVQASYGRYKKTSSVNLSISNETIIIFDSHPPTISDVFPQWNQQNLQVRAVISDDGQYASGLRDGNASIDLFYIGEDKVQRQVPMYGVGYNLFEGLVPTQPGMGTIRYIVQATDADGNTASEADTFVIPTTAIPGNGTQGGKPPLDAIIEMFGGGWTIIPIIIFIIAIIIVGGYWYYNTRKAPSEEGEEPEYKYRTKEEKAEQAKEKKDIKKMVPKKREGKPVPPKPPAAKK